MALFYCQFRSNMLQQNTKFNVIIPEQCEKDIPTVYLLHGMYGNEDQWIRGSSIERYANERGLAVVMPFAANSFYHDSGFGSRYFSYVAKELVEYTRKIFPLSEKREKTFAAGLSMGGYGAMKCALTFPEQYAACASLSGCVDLLHCLKNTSPESKSNAQMVWGKDYLETIPGSGDDIYALIGRIERENLPKPGIFQACGTEDFLYQNNQRMREYFQDRDFLYCYQEGPGIHDFTVWDRDIQKALDFFLDTMREAKAERNTLQGPQ